MSVCRQALPEGSCACGFCLLWVNRVARTRYDIPQALPERTPRVQGPLATRNGVRVGRDGTNLRQWRPASKAGFAAHGLSCSVGLAHRAAAPTQIDVREHPVRAADSKANQDLTDNASRCSSDSMDPRSARLPAGLENQLRTGSFKFRRLLLVGVRAQWIPKRARRRYSASRLEAPNGIAHRRTRARGQRYHGTRRG